MIGGERRSAADHQECVQYKGHMTYKGQMIIILMIGGEGRGPADHQVSYRDKHRRTSTNSQKFSLQWLYIVNVLGH